MLGASCLSDVRDCQDAAAERVRMTGRLSYDEGESWPDSASIG